MNRRAAVIGAIVVALVLGLWLLLGDSPSSGAIGGSARPSARLTQRTPAPRAPSAKEPRSSASAQRLTSPAQGEAAPVGVLAVEVHAEGTPLPEAQVQVYRREPADAPTPVAQWLGMSGGETAEDGRWESPAAPGTYFVVARAEGFAPASLGVEHPPGEVRTPVRLRLEEGTELSGFIVAKGTGDPVSLAEVILAPLSFPAGQGAGDEPEEERLYATSSDTGEFLFTGLATGRYRAEIRAPGYLTRVVPSLPVPFGGHPTFELLPGGRIEGLVVNADGQPVAGAKVLASSRPHEAQAFTDAAGGFSLELPPGTYSVTASHEAQAGELGHPVTVARDERVQGLRIQLGAAARISGTVLWEDGTPIIGARMEATLQGTSVQGLAGTDLNGAFSISSLAPGTYFLSASLPGAGGMPHTSVTVSQGEHATVTLTQDLRGGISVLVRASTGMTGPLEGIQVRVSPSVSQGQSAISPMEGRTKAEGQFRLTGLAPGEYRVEVQRAPGSRRFVQWVNVKQNVLRSLSFYVPRAEEEDGAVVEVEGRVVQRSGAPLVGPVEIVATRGPPRHRRQRVLADGQGRFQLLLEPGEYSLVAKAPGRSSCQPEGRAQLQVEAGQPSLAVTLRLDEPGAPDLRLHVLRADGAPLRLAHVSMRFQSFYTSEETDEEGRIKVCFPPNRQLGFPLELRFHEERQFAVVEQASGPELTIRLHALPSVRGRVVSLSGAPIQRFQLERWGLTAFGAPSPQDLVGNAFELRGVLPEQGKLIVRAADGRVGMAELDLRQGKDLSVEIPVYPAVPVTGRLVDATSRAPVAGVEVVLFPFSRAFTTQDGRFTLRDIPPGEHQLEIVRGSSMTHPVKLLPGQPHDVGDIPLTAP